LCHEFCKEALGAGELLRVTSSDGTVSHAELKIGDSVLFVSGGSSGMSPAFASRALASAFLFLHVEEVDATFNRVTPGCRADMEVMNMFWGDRYGKVTDPYGHQW
jgi:PhnB protein